MSDQYKIFNGVPVDLGRFNCITNEVLYYLYLPVSMPSYSDFVIPEALNPFCVLLHEVHRNEPSRFIDEYIYITVKRMFVGNGLSANRPGWHSDGFMSDDLNYVWYDSAPTVFTKGTFFLTLDHIVSLREMNEQANVSDEIMYPTCHLLKLDQHVIHRVNEDIPKMIMRTFVKISISKKRYNLIGNSHNYLIPYTWTMHDRSIIRNDPSKAQGDSGDI